jgi:hypothetical protein
MFVFSWTLTFHDPDQVVTDTLFMRSMRSMRGGIIFRNRGLLDAGLLFCQQASHVSLLRGQQRWFPIGRTH